MSVHTRTHTHSAVVVVNTVCLLMVSNMFLFIQETHSVHFPCLLRYITFNNHFLSPPPSLPPFPPPLPPQLQQWPRVLLQRNTTCSQLVRRERPQGHNGVCAAVEERSTLCRVPHHGPGDPQSALQGEGAIVYTLAENRAQENRVLRRPFHRAVGQRNKRRHRFKRQLSRYSKGERKLEENHRNQVIDVYVCKRQIHGAGGPSREARPRTKAPTAYGTSEIVLQGWVHVQRSRATSVSVRREV